MTEPFDIEKEADWIAVQSRQDAVSCADLKNLVEAFGRRCWNEAIEEAAEIAGNHNGCVDVECLSKSNCGATAANQIFALKRGPQ